MLARLLLLTLALMLSSRLFSAETEMVLDTAERYVRLQTQGLPGKVTITMGKLDTNRLPACTALEAFSPPGTRLSGKIYIGVRCLGPNIWSVLVPAQIAVTGNYVTTARSLAAGQAVQATDLTTLSGDMSSLPAGIITDPANATGRRATITQRPVARATGHSPRPDRSGNFEGPRVCCQRRGQSPQQCCCWSDRPNSYELRANR